MPVSTPVSITLFFSRPKNPAPTVVETRLQREFDAAVGEIEAQENIQEACTRLAVWFGLVGVALLASPLIARYITIAAQVQAVLSMLGVIICATSFVFYCAIYKRRADEFAVDLCQKYDEIYKIGKKAAELSPQK